MDQTALPQRAGQAGLGGVDQPGRAVGDDQQRRAQPTRLEFVEEVAPGVGRLRSAGGQSDEYRRAFGGDAPRGQHRFGTGTGVHLEHGSVQEQVVQFQLVQAPRRPGLELLGDRLADPRDRRLRQSRLGAERIGQGVLHVAHRQATHEPGDHQRLQRVGLGDALAEQLRGEPLGRIAQLRPRHGNRPGGGLDRRVAVAVTHPRPRLSAASGPLVAGPAQEHIDLGLHRGLDDQPGTQAGDVLDNLR